MQTPMYMIENYKPGLIALLSYISSTISMAAFLVPLRQGGSKCTLQCEHNNSFDHSKFRDLPAKISFEARSKLA